MTRFSYLLIATFAALISLLNTSSFANSSNTNTFEVARFSAMDLDAWERKIFENETNYSLVEENQTYYLQAHSTQSASALYKKLKVDLHNTPYLNWSWRIDQGLPPLNEKEKNGDDYAARIYIVFKTGFTPLSVRALNYVWSSNNLQDSSWPNAFTKKSIMIPLRTQQDGLHVWQHEKVNIKEDLLKHFESMPKHIEGIAIMTDTDNSGNSASASYGDIYFSKE